jgi:glycosyltransferase involved in cell wall biosynthesis
MRDPGRRFRLLALLSHPIQYLVPLMRELAAHPRIDLMVCFMTDTGLRAGYVEGYGETLKWDIPLLDGYPHKFLENVSRRAVAGDPLSRINPGVALELARGHYDGVMLQGYVTVSDWLGLVAAKATGTKVLFFGEVLLDSPRHAGMAPWARELFRRAWCKSIDAALPHGSQGRRFYEHYHVPKERVFWAPLCVDNARWMSLSDELRPKRAELKREIGLDPELPVVLFVAHLRPNKRPLDVVKGFERMKTRASLVMVGGGPLFDEVERYVRERGVARVHLAGMQNQTHIPRFYALGDLFVLASGPGEVTPLVIYEAMCSSLALVISDAVPSVIDTVREGENGFSYPLGDVDALADRFDRVLGDPATAAAMSARSRAMVASRTYDVTAASIVTALDAVCGER